MRDFYTWSNSRYKPKGIKGKEKEKIRHPQRAFAGNSGPSFRDAATGDNREGEEGVKREEIRDGISRRDLLDFMLFLLFREPRIRAEGLLIRSRKRLAVAVVGIERSAILPPSSFLLSDSARRLFPR